SMPDQGPITAPKGSASSTPPPDGTTLGTPSQEPGTSPTAPPVDAGTAKSDKADQVQTPAKTDDTEPFYDPKDLPEELLPYHKQLQAAFTKKTQALKKDREKIEAFDAFMADVPGSLQRAAQQYGFRMVPMQQPNQPGYPPQAGAEGNQPFGPDWQPGSYEELYQTFANRCYQEAQQRLGPVFKNVERLTASNVERQLSEIDSDWKLYEEDMMDNLKQHPTLVNDVPKLYKMSVPDEVLKSRATQAALKKMETKAKSAQIQGKGTAAPTTQPRGKMDFQASVDAAREQLARQGLTP
ncbi:MAG: hypothetical protein ACFFCW_26195, partial [Candidatus Hodarchaeota archaeon]